MPRCKHCHEKFEQYEFNCKFCKKIDCQVQKGLWKLEKLKEKKLKDVNRSIKNKVSNNTGVYSKELKEYLQIEINRIVRLIDKGVRCIDCDRTESKQWDSGHYRSVGSNSTLRYHLDNIFQQSGYCNGYSEGNKGAYMEGIIKMYGEGYGVYVSKMNIEYPLIKLHHSEYPDILKEARKIVRELKKADQTYPPKVRIRLRKEYNLRLGIYKN